MVPVVGYIRHDERRRRHDRRRLRIRFRVIGVRAGRSGRRLLRGGRAAIAISSPMRHIVLASIVMVRLAH